MTIYQPFKTEIEKLPVNLRSVADLFVQQLQEKLTPQNLLLPKNRDFQQSLVPVWLCSQFISESCLRKPALLIDLVESGDLFNAELRGLYAQSLASKKVSNDAELMQQLRLFRRREMVRIAWRDLAGWSDLTETLADLSELASVCIQTALDFLYQQACQRRGVPVYADDGTPQQLLVLGMGKLGAYELNYSSDIDLIFAYGEEGELSDRKQTSYNEFFSRLARQLVKVLDEITADGFVFRTDIRLRPFGDSGAIAMTLEGMENYYHTQAREWERYAMIKARPMLGDERVIKQFNAIIQPFVYRRYLDYGAFEELRSLKLQITLELQRKDRLENVKLGPGGIREIEFIGQAFQLIRGGKEIKLQQREIQIILAELAHLNLLPIEIVELLQSAYVFLRRVENHIQQYQDRQAHDLPTDEQHQAILAFSLGFENWAVFKAELDNIRQQVHQVFGDVFSINDDCGQQGRFIWLEEADAPILEQQLQDLGYQQPRQVIEYLKDFKRAGAIKRLTTKGASTLDRLMPQLLEELPKQNHPETTLKRLLILFEAVAGRNVYLALLAENPNALAQLIKLSEASSWICEYLAHYPVLFDELLDTRSLYAPLEQEQLQARLNRHLQHCDNDDLEQVMIALRQFKHINVLRVAAADIMGAIPLMVVSDYLTDIAEVIVQQVVKQVWKILAEKHGVPVGTKLNEVSGFAVLGFGKMGGFELGYGSDLDMVFLYNCTDGNALTNGHKAISVAQFYGRLGQKVMHILNTNMLSGMLYEVDMRLRPSGNSGLLVSLITAYEDYMLKEAWTWEHQALVRGRFVAGDIILKTEFEKIRHKILSQPRENAKLKQQVREMRQKMRENLAKEAGGKFDVKQSKGGIADIEFMVQFGVLSQSAEYPDLSTYTDNVRLIDGLVNQGFFSIIQAEKLKAAYCTYRDYGHRQVLQGKKVLVDKCYFIEEREFVEKLWAEVME